MIEFNVEWQGHAIATAAGSRFTPEFDVVIANTSDDALLGGVTYYGYTQAAISMHVASFAPNWLTRDLLWVAFHYPFVQLGCAKIITTTPSYNLKSLAINRRLGFKEEAVIKDAFPEGNAVVMGMRAADCRWLSLTPKAIQEGAKRGEKRECPEGS